VEKKTLMMVRLLFIVIFLLISASLLADIALAACTYSNTPQLKPDNYFELYEGIPFSHEFNLTSADKTGVTFTYALFDTQLKGIRMSSNGVLNFIPASADVGVSRVAIIAAEGSCANTIIATFKVFARPKIVSFSPNILSFEMNQTDSIDFEIRAEDSDANELLKYEWMLDNSAMRQYDDKKLISFLPGFDIFGSHNLTVRVIDPHNLSENVTWYLKIFQVNRRPVLINNISDFLLFRSTAATAYSLNDYFKDPDGGKLTFSFREIKPEVNLNALAYLNSSFINISTSIDKLGYVSYNPMTDGLGYAYFVFTAYDIMNASADSNIVKIEVVSGDQFKNTNNTPLNSSCGDFYCSQSENCTTCPIDCGECRIEDQSGCKPEWSCADWGPCQPAGFQTRNCTDLGACQDNRTRPELMKACIYNATCNDGLKNGIETGVDCGGPCPPCANCSDGIQNQGETGVDCGGPCPMLCPNCSDGIKNQNESDIDCGGPCAPCAGGKKCLKNLDCASLRCDRMVCTFPSCNDSIRNQGEEGIDCGGPCEKLCGNCSDGIQNRGEEGIDCGGRCAPCPTCDDGTKNGNETLADCGGECRSCTVVDYFNAYMAWFIIAFVVLGFAPLTFFSYMFFLFANPDRARSLYQNNASFAMLIGLHKFKAKFRRLRGNFPVLTEEVAKKLSAELTEIGKAQDGNKRLHDEIKKIYALLFTLPLDYDENIFKMRVRSSPIPLFIKILLVGYYKRAEILTISTFVPLEEKVDLIFELKYLMLELAKG
jgi:hypothetical protein